MSETNNPQLEWLDKNIAKLKEQAEALRPYSTNRIKMEVQIAELKRYRHRLTTITIRDSDAPETRNTDV